MDICDSNSRISPILSASHDIHEVRGESKPFVSVVIPCYNSRLTIGECLSGLEMQTYPRERFEVIVADNGSTDGSQDLILNQYPRVRLLHAKQKGSGFARNAGISAAKGTYVLSTDADCIADPGWITALVNAMESAPLDTAAIGGFIAPYSQRTMVERYRPAWVGQPHVSNSKNKLIYAATPNAIFCARRIREVGGFDGTLGFDDTDLGIRFAASGYRIQFTDNAVVRHRNPASLREVYRHRLKYAKFSFTLAQKHPGILDDPCGGAQRRKLLRETVGRMVKDTAKLPLSIVYRPEGSSFGWPIVDAVIALANYRGYSSASHEYETRKEARNTVGVGSGRSGSASSHHDNSVSPG